MPKPLFTKLVAICAIGFLCSSFGIVYGLNARDKSLCILSSLIGLCSIVRFFLLFQQFRTKSYCTLTGICTKHIPSALWNKTQKIMFTTPEGTEYEFALDKHLKLLTGHHYRLYFKPQLSGTADSVYSSHYFLGFEELPAPAS
ncbi:hypothetical protein [Luxibacter massiliensis]|uniref:hypothetical protein n=1 Tax=Luxibacter massiliensis TaxID=2219695 RepID=UPI000F063329|nr:hypothetical protein [Luxibacter massiliensis]